MRGLLSTNGITAADSVRCLTLVRILIGETDRCEHRPHRGRALHQALLRLAFDLPEDERSKHGTEGIAPDGPAGESPPSARE